MFVRLLVVCRCGPHLNKRWTKEEELKLLELVAKYEEHDWESITAELGTGRSMMQVQHSLVITWLTQ